MSKRPKALGGLDGIIAAGSKGAKNVGEALSSGAGAVRSGVDGVASWLENAGKNAGLAHDPAFALPGGGAIRESELGRAGVFENRAQNVNSGSRRNLQTHEASGGHTIDRHVGKSDTWLRARLAAEPDLEAASTFTNEAAANRAQGAFVNKKSDVINNWLESPKKPHRLEVQFDMGKPVGQVLRKGETATKTTTSVHFTLVRDSSARGWHFLTSFPQE